MHLDGTCSEYECDDYEVNNNFVCQCEEGYALHQDGDHCVDKCEEDYYIKDGKCVYYSDCGWGWVASDADDETKGKCIPKNECFRVDLLGVRCIGKCEDGTYLNEKMGKRCVAPQLCGNTQGVVDWVGDDREGSETKGKCIQKTACNGFVDTTNFLCLTSCKYGYYIKDGEDYDQCVLPILCEGVGSELEGTKGHCIS